MPSSFPSSVDSLSEAFTNATENEDVAAAWQNLAAQAIKAVQTELGVGGNGAKGGFGSVLERLNVADFFRASNGKGIVKHGSNASLARPTAGFASYEWQGTVAPLNAIDGDTWIDTAL